MELEEHTQSPTITKAPSVHGLERFDNKQNYFDKDTNDNYLKQKRSAGHIYLIKRPEFADKPMLLFDEYAIERMPEVFNEKMSSYHDRDFDVISSISPAFQKREDLAAEYSIRESESSYPSKKQDISREELSRLMIVR